MSINRFFVVGDKFQNFSQINNVITASELESMLDDQAVENNFRFYLGQGLSEETTRNLLHKAEQQAKQFLFEFNPLIKSGRELSHKHQERNSMLGFPKKLSESLFEVDMLLDENCDEMGDHVTGYHVQGMVLTEAARQTFLAVTEEYFLGDMKGSSYFVINNLDTEYHRFLFPLPATILYQVKDSKEKKGGSLYFDIEMSVIQNGELCATVRTKFTTYDNKFLQKKEADLASAAVTEGLKRMEDNEVAA
ncbi:AfsA-related hotdog domain-containing protein [Litoribacillus peritrichatus]|uniref:AfsA-related hotdog domain-containing protein n=1 Tax=Litoribacillus peritrichatus TaxID=718191 RepID=A0ABP7M5Y3_9GAMM